MLLWRLSPPAPTARRLGQGAPPDARAQGRIWAESRLLELFGREGLAALAPRLAALDSPFSAVATLSETARRAVHECLKNI